MTAIPPNNLEQLVAWIRLFAEEILLRIKKLEEKVFKMEKEE
jgi:hypothetical protein